MKAQHPGTESAARVSDVLLAFLEESPLGVTALARKLGISKSVVHRILQTLVDHGGLLVHDPVTRTYRLGQVAAALGARVIQDCPLQDTAVPYMHRLYELSGETVALSVLAGLEWINVTQIESTQPVRMRVEIGRRSPLYVGSTGLTLLAFVSPEDREHVLSGDMRPHTAVTITDRHELACITEVIAERGFGHSVVDRIEGAAAVSAPVFGPYGRLLGALSVLGPTPRLTRERRLELGPTVSRAAAELSSDLEARWLIP
ncbi:IclR family transcriptional regulator [Rhodococcus sp. IEGM 1366]|uniref:IclR family transcriptional regulator n=1 Tax=Rhodococcus sp. IEGM 1366 TaxID=3082223 RepID=UPI00295524A7|nr:IclR family transcriptional regulator [Rhodococcus sp. IEGM 1366]MDV8071311.1 IclR family transcriptional regulator [Rhodococcus sp. IEGM 1366]